MIFLIIVEFAYQRNFHKTFGCNPFYAIYIYNPTLELNTEKGIPRKKVAATKKKIKEIDTLKHDFEKRW